ncbi:hypothetical protein Cgig2_008879 [Carnegiea gigantea]|uniref:Uncharacterized protein n=1 Tax=Carnegiea gigantea TaxID=171969 RepID=A0A9Q1JL41_9CARY|nr:hypothetical protein Cgig2_008879 [Carnegiea gigantea]
MDVKGSDRSCGTCVGHATKAQKHTVVDSVCVKEIEVNEGPPVVAGDVESCISSEEIQGMKSSVSGGVNPITIHDKSQSAEVVAASNGELLKVIKALFLLTPFFPGYLLSICCKSSMIVGHFLPSDYRGLLSELLLFPTYNCLPNRKRWHSESPKLHQQVGSITLAEVEVEVAADGEIVSGLEREPNGAMNAEGVV